MTTTIEWTDETWNPAVGCERVSLGCDHCYAIGVAHRAMQPAHVGLTIKRKGEPVDWTGTVRCLPDRLDTPLKWRKPRRVFVGSMSDLFHPDVPDWFIGSVFSTMAATRRHSYQVLTKRPRRMALWTHDHYHRHGVEIGSNVWLGTSIESAKYLWRADRLRATWAAVRFLSIEPLLGPLPDLDLTSIDWVIVGGESGSGARPMHPDWVRDIRDRCVAEGVPFFFKQWGEWLPLRGHREFLDLPPRQREWGTVGGHVADGGATVVRVGKKAAGRTLDGRTWDEMPEVAR